MQEKYGCKGKKLYFAFVDLEKAFDKVPREVTRWALRKAEVDECLVKAVMAMYEGAQTVVRTTEGDSKAFIVKVGLHQGSILSPLLFVIVMEIISRELQAGLPLELLYADDLILIAESEESLCDKIVKWKSRLEAKGLKMNTGKTKVMFSHSMKDRVEEKGKWPCGVCKKEVGNNSILCHSCKKWIHKRSSGVKGSLRNPSQLFICRCCKVDMPITDGLNNDLHLVMGYCWKR